MTLESSTPAEAKYVACAADATRKPVSNGRSSRTIEALEIVA